MKKWLLCLFSYNRPALLANAIRSIEGFFPWGDRLLLDDGSSDPRIIKLMEEIRKHPRWQCVIRDRHTKQSYGGFYVNMGKALTHALEGGYDYCFFFEDDEQLLWFKSDYPEYVDHVFSVCPDAVQIQPLFYRRIVSYTQSLEYLQPANAYRSERGFSTTAIWNLDVVRRHPDYNFYSKHGDDLPANSAYWLRKGYRLYMQFDPTVAVMPWVQSQSEQIGQSANGTSAGGNEYFLRPLQANQISFLRSRSPELLAYQEYFLEANPSKVRPIWHQYGQNLNRYYQLCRLTVDEEDRLGQSPTNVRVLEEWRPSDIPPLQSHLMWDPYRPPAPVSAARKLVRSFASLLPQSILDWRHFKLRDYFGYRILSQRLRREISALPFSKQ